ncbi:NAD(P)/FAD-dependent oxidoreductase [Glutamicibacter nicotianae]|uniref:FAD-dependent oxidoreductase n=1 Tax=Glutamicibacter nicotianae TaxID=37929 RepID=A0ABQ0RJR0_GLUNI|nr:FAD-binding oxidoreductase [Glutamicibacter nicotianae]GEC12046.1 FAD-dependent oxidoreductase [Glutamicibacter nicotianae]
MSTETGSAPKFVNGDVSFWMRSTETPVRRPALDGHTTADVAIIGAGLTGLWTAYYLKKARPNLDIAIIEREYAGFGASGRNGGWMSAEPAGQFKRYAKSGGLQGARDLQREMFGAVRQSVEVARAEGFDEDLAHDGLIHVATNAAQLSRLSHHVAEMKEQGWGQNDVFQLSPHELAQRVHVEGAQGGYWTPHCARVHPAKYTRGLAKVVEDLGVKIYESTTALSVEQHLVKTDRGNVSANFIVEALEGYTSSLKGKARKLLPMNSSMVITEQLTDAQLKTVGWHGGELVGDAAHSFTYMHRTQDGRIAIGGRGVPYNFRSSFDRNGKTAESAVILLKQRLGELFPSLANVNLEQSWSGVLGVPRDWCASVNFDKSSNILSAGGYVGHGLSGTNLAGRTLRDLILGETTTLTTLPWIGRQARNWEVEPIRWIGATALYGVYRYADNREYANAQPRTHWTARMANVVSGR